MHGIRNDNVPHDNVCAWHAHAELWNNNDFMSFYWLPDAWYDENFAVRSSCYLYSFVPLKTRLRPLLSWKVDCVFHGLYNFKGMRFTMQHTTRDMSKGLSRVLLSERPAFISQAKSYLRQSLYQRTQETQDEMETTEKSLKKQLNIALFRTRKAACFQQSVNKLLHLSMPSEAWIDCRFHQGRENQDRKHHRWFGWDKKTVIIMLFDLCLWDNCKIKPFCSACACGRWFKEVLISCFFPFKTCFTCCDSFVMSIN